jgi:hydroxymethylpyrimidine/phosphomethylpyrimidine kinase
MSKRSVPIALTIAGSDSGGGAGIQADLKTFAALGVYGCSAITALTAQNSRGVQGAWEVPPRFIAAQMDAVLGDLPVAAAKTGMLSSAAVVEVVAERLRAHGVQNLVVDPVLFAKDRTRLLDDAGARRLIEDLLPLAAVVTPNAPEAGFLTGVEVKDPQGAEEAARRLLDLGCGAALVKGGHLEGDSAVDVLCAGGSCERLEYPRLPGPAVHGTGCVLSAAIAGYLALGEALPEAVRRARAFLQGAIERARALTGGFRLFTDLGGG